MKRVAVLVSGGGTNLQALLDAQRDGKIPHGEIALVISSQACAYALERAEKANVPAHTVPSSLIQHDFEAAIELLLEQYKIDVIVLAGKGHEDYQEIHGVKHHMDERDLIREILEEEDVTNICGYNNRYFA